MKQSAYLLSDTTRESGFARALKLLPRLIVWLLVFAFFPLSGTACLTSFQREVLGCKNSSPGRAPEKEQAAVRVESVLAYLERAEFKEIDPWVRDDLRIAWITVLLASRGEAIPHITASYRVLGLHPEKVWPAILARRAALLGRAPRKKPSARVTELEAQKQRKG
jgi:hypothetical protein